MSLFNRKNKAGRLSQLPANLRDDAQKFKVIVDSIEDGVILVDSQHVVQLINPAAAKMCGWPTDEATGIDVFSVVKLVDDKGELISDDQNPFHKVFTDGQSVRGKNVFLMARDKKQIAISLNITPLVDSGNSIMAAAAVFRDVTKEHAEQQQRGDFISTASHEMRTPVAAVEGYLALALNDKVATIDGRARGYLDKAYASTQSLGKLFQDLLTSAKAEDGRLTSHPAVVEMGEFLEKLSGDLRLVAEKKGLTVDFVSSTNNDHVINATEEGEGGEKVIRPLYYANVDPDRIREVITNLFDNAVKYTDEGKVSIGLTGNDQVVQCFVSDTGPGIPGEDLPHLFQKFYRVDNSATRTVGGTGLGLFICRKIVELYGGRIWAESELGKGSSFYINLPRINSPAKIKELQAAEDTTVTPTAPSAVTAAPPPITPPTAST